MKTAIGVLVLAGLGVGVVLLWPTAVPDDLLLADVDESAVFGAELVARAERFERFLFVLWIHSQIALFATLWVYARKGVRFAQESAAGPIGTGMLLGMLGLAIVWLVNLPFRVAGHWWARRYEVSDADYLTWLLDDWILLGAQFVSVCLALLIVMGLARRLGDWWWLPGAATFVGIAALFTFAAPYIDYTTEPLRDRTLLEAADRFERELGLPDVPVHVQEVSEDTERANAYAYGFGPSRRIVLWDTVLDDPFDSGEQKVVLAHELAHHSQRHLTEGIGWFAIFAVPGTFVLMLATRSRGGIGVPEAIPLALIVAASFQLATAPAANWVTRRMEAEADWKALEVTQDPEAVEGAMVGLSETSLGDPYPPAWVQIMLGTHPPLADRVGMARAWAARRQRERNVIGHTSIVSTSCR
ncbi:MAG: M48 family metalloprotease [Actinomycetota bacterium]|nr:M48 family metalloprotease [Actinomycetota bacterium]